MLKMQLIGNLGRDAEIRTVGDSSVINFAVAHSESYTNRNGVKEERTTWVNCSYWRSQERLAVAQYLKKGTQVFLEGIPSVRAYVDKNGQPAASLELRVSELKLISGNRKDETAITNDGVPSNPQASSPNGAVPTPLQDNVPQPDDDDLPF